MVTESDRFDNIKHCSCFGLIHCSVVGEQKFIERLMGQGGAQNATKFVTRKIKYESDVRMFYFNINSYPD